MTGHASLYVAERAWTCITPEAASRLLEVDSPAWLLPFLRLAGGAGEEAGTRVLTDPALGRPRDLGAHGTRLEEVEIGDRLMRGRGGASSRTLLWRTAGFASLFRRLEGDLSATPQASGTVLGLEGSFECPASLEAAPNGALAGRRAAETAVRALLGYLRSALEQADADEMLA